MKYFIDVVNFVDKHILWVVALFLLACIVEFIVFLFKKRGGNFDADGLFICISTNLVVTIGIYILACLGVGIVNCLKDQNWHFWARYMTFLGNGGYALLGLFFIGIGIYFMIKNDDADTFLGRLIASALAAAIATVVAFFAGFVIYIVVAIVIIILKVLWFVVSGFFLSIFQFVAKYWIMSIVVLAGPGVIYGASCALVNYVRSFNNEVVHKQ